MLATIRARAVLFYSVYRYYGQDKAFKAKAPQICFVSHNSLSKVQGNYGGPGGMSNDGDF